MKTYSIEGCPIPFHDLVEIGDFLTHLSPSSLMLFAYSRVMVDDVPIFWIRVYTKPFVYVSYKSYPHGTAV